MYRIVFSTRKEVFQNTGTAMGFCSLARQDNAQPELTRV